jgi:hypothetical protein
VRIYISRKVAHSIHEASRRGHVDVADIEAKDAYTEHARVTSLESGFLQEQKGAFSEQKNRSRGPNVWTWSSVICHMAKRETTRDAIPVDYEGLDSSVVEHLIVEIKRVSIWGSPNGHECLMEQINGQADAAFNGTARERIYWIAAIGLHWTYGRKGGKDDNGQGLIPMAIGTLPFTMQYHIMISCN